MTSNKKPAPRADIINCRRCGQEMTGTICVQCLGALNYLRREEEKRTRRIRLLLVLCGLGALIAVTLGSFYYG